MSTKNYFILVEVPLTIPYGRIVQETTDCPSPEEVITARLCHPGKSLILASFDWGVPGWRPYIGTEWFLFRDSESNKFERYLYRVHTAHTEEIC